MDCAVSLIVIFYHFAVVYKSIIFKITPCRESWINETLIRLLDIHVISTLKDLRMFRNSDLDCELDSYVSKSNKKKRIIFFALGKMEIGHLSVMSFEDYSESSMPYKVLLVVNKFTDVFRHRREELLTPRGRMYKVLSLRRRIIF